MKNKSQKKQSTSAVEAHEPPYPKGQRAANFIGSWRALFEDILRRRRKTRIHFFNNGF